jgi:hypothetical protein
MKITKKWLTDQDACSNGKAWAVSVIGKGMAVKTMLPKFNRADWMLWLLWHSKSVSIRQLCWLACVCGRVSLRHVPKGEDSPRLAYEAAEAYLLNPSGAAGDAAGAARAAGDAAGAARAAAWAAGAAAWAAGDAAWAAAWAAEHRKMCALIIAEMKKPSFKKLKGERRTR